MFHGGLCAKAEHELDSLEILVNLSKGSRVLDVCCGIGRHSIELAKRGFQVTAIDKVATYIYKAEQTARDKGLSAAFISADFLNYTFSDKFHTIICLWNSFGFNESCSDDVLFLNKTFNLLEPGGVFVLGFCGKEIAVRDFQSQKIKKIDQYTLIKERTIVNGGDFLNAQWYLYKSNSLVGKFQINQRLYSKGLISECISSAGFHDYSIYGDLDGSPYDKNAKQMLVVAKRGDRDTHN